MNEGRREKKERTDRQMTNERMNKWMNEDRRWGWELSRMNEWMNEWIGWRGGRIDWGGEGVSRKNKKQKNAGSGLKKGN